MTHEKINKAIINHLNSKGYNWFYELFESPRKTGKGNIDQAKFGFSYKELYIEIEINGTCIDKVVYCDTLGEIQELTEEDNLQQLFDNWYEYYSRFIEEYDNMDMTYCTLNQKYR